MGMICVKQRLAFRRCAEFVEAEVEEKIFNNRFASVISIPSWW
jgi:hypothetical protein